MLIKRSGLRTGSARLGRPPDDGADPYYRRTPRGIALTVPQVKGAFTRFHLLTSCVLIAEIGPPSPATPA
jgi:hypothetical protein